MLAQTSFSGVLEACHYRDSDRELTFLKISHFSMPCRLSPFVYHLELMETTVGQALGRNCIPRDER